MPPSYPSNNCAKEVPWLSFRKKYCIVLYQGKVVLTGKINIKTDLWDVPIAPTETPGHVPQSHNNMYKLPQINNVFTIKSAQARIKYLHQCLYSPPITTLLAAVNNNQLDTWPGLTARAIRWYLLEAPATEKGHMKRSWKGLCSTTRIHLTKVQRDTIRAITNTGKCKQPLKGINEKVRITKAQQNNIRAVIR